MKPGFYRREWSILHPIGYNRQSSNRLFYGCGKTMQFDRLGPYKIGNRIGRGGMGAVFEGVNVETGELAAIKILNPHLADDEGFRERFEMEIDTLKKLKHPNIVRMYGYGEQDGHLYYAMELVNGHSVEEELQLGRRFSWREVVHYSVALCKALRHAHDHGVIHRDLKPANLLLTDSEDEIKLTDFGIARLFGNNRLTMDGALVRHRRIHVARAGQWRAGYAAERFVQPGRCHVCHARRKAAVSHAGFE